MAEKITVGIIGSGAMGAGIAQVAATAGHNVVLYDSNEAALKRAGENLGVTITRLIEKNKISGEEGRQILGRIRLVPGLSEFSSCGLVIEAIVENLEVKQKVFAELDNIVSPQCILASNTSSLSITSIASAVKDPSRVAGIHFFNPAPLMPLVEIIPGIATSGPVIESSKKIITEMGKVVVLCKDTPGFIVNRIARPFYGESIRIYEEGIADMATIDWALREKGCFRMGPFELMDLIGHDVNYTVTETVWKQFYFDPRYKPSLSQKRLVEAGRTGRKSGLGFYDYSAEAARPEPKKNDQLGEEIFLRVVSMLVNEAAEALYLGIGSREDIDLAMTKGVNYPMGLLKWGDDLGLNKILGTLEHLRGFYSEDRYRPSVLLKKMVREGRKFWD